MNRRRTENRWNNPSPRDGYQARIKDGGARSGGGIERNGDDGSAVSGDGVDGTAARAARALNANGSVTANDEAMDTFFGGQSMFLLKLGVCEAVSSLCPIRVSAGTQTSTKTPKITAARAAESASRKVCLEFNKAIEPYCNGANARAQGLRATGRRPVHLPA